MSDSGVPGARERLRRALREYAGRSRAMAAARPAADAGALRARAPAAPAFARDTARRRAAGPVTAPYDERGLRALAKEIKALISEDSRRGIGVG